MCIRKSGDMENVYSKFFSSNQVAELTEAMRGNEQVPMKNLLNSFPESHLESF